WGGVTNFIILFNKVSISMGYYANIVKLTFRIKINNHALKDLLINHITKPVIETRARASPVKGTMSM
ncbi:MAG: hypothetical protein PWR03_2020, partial [Tenuifilum sp.]|nr:hypothetical protein [Tenuifilum sp.]